MRVKKEKQLGNKIGRADEFMRLLQLSETNKEAAFKLGLMYLNGDGVSQNTQRARFYFEHASSLAWKEHAENGNSWLVSYQELEAVNGFMFKYGKPDLAVNLKDAAWFFEMAGWYGETIDEPLMWEALNLYLFGGKDRTPLDVRLGFGYLLSMAEDCNIGYAQYLVGMAYEKGLWGQEVNAEKAKEWYAKANQQGYSKNDTWNNLTL